LIANRSKISQLADVSPRHRTNHDPMSPCADLITTYCEYLRVELERADRTIDHRRAVLTKADRELPRGLEATRDEIQAWLQRPGQRGPLTANARASYRAALAGFYTHFAGRRGGLACDPVADIRRPKTPAGSPRPVSHDQLRRVLAEAADPYRLWVLLAAGLGARDVEISRLDRDDVTEEITWLSGKGDKHRVVPTPQQVYDAVRQLPPGRVARTRRGLPASAQYISQMAGTQFRKLGLTGVTMHRFRHWYATYLDTADIQVAQQLLGHAKPATTAIYRRVQPQLLHAAVSGLPLPASGAAAARRTP
jgi:integrase/recombinase XerC